ncbi:MAG: molybdenum cofactor guanylyltransferase [Verrucomicrobiota bacterium]
MSRPIAAALIMGGKSRRMGDGIDKAQLTIDETGEPLWRIQLGKLAALEPAELFISKRHDQAGFEFPGAEFVPDAKPEAGPLAGIAACLKRATQPLLLCLAVDMPRVTSAFLDQQLLARADAERGLVPRIDGRWEPFAAVYPSRLADLAFRCLETDDLSLQSFIRKAELQTWDVEPREQSWFVNINTPEDLAVIQPQS